MIEPKITMMSCKDGKLSGKVVLNGTEWFVQPFEVTSDASASEKENKLIERAIRSWAMSNLEVYCKNCGESPENCQCNSRIENPVIEQGRKHSHYHKDVSDYDTIDVYAVCKIFDVQDPSGCLQHAIKKLLVTGQRGHKDRKTDIQNAIDTLNRLLELEHGKDK